MMNAAMIKLCCVKENRGLKLSATESNLKYNEVRSGVGNLQKRRIEAILYLSGELFQTVVKGIGSVYLMGGGGGGLKT